MIKVFFSGLLFCITIASAAETTYYGSNREVFSSAKSSSLSGSDICYADDASPTGNSANLGFTPEERLSICYSPLYLHTVDVSAFSATLNLSPRLGVGVSQNYLLVSNIEDNRAFETRPDGTPIYDPAKIRYFSASEYYFYGALGYKVFSRGATDLSVGAGFNAQRRRLDELTGYGLGLDLGVTARHALLGLRTSLVGQNVTTNYMRFDPAHSYQTLPHVYWGAGWERNFNYFISSLGLYYTTIDLLSNEPGYVSQKIKIRSASGIIDTVIEPRWIHALDEPVLFFFAGKFGTQVEVYKLINFRASWTRSTWSDETAYSVGAGLALYNKRLAVDIAYVHQPFLPWTPAGSISYTWR
jgi:hypothetical protein